MAGQLPVSVIVRLFTNSEPWTDRVKVPKPSIMHNILRVSDKTHGSTRLREKGPFTLRDCDSTLVGDKLMNVQLILSHSHSRTNLKGVVLNYAPVKIDSL